jgi:hypothetical protein
MSIRYTGLSIGRERPRKRGRKRLQTGLLTMKSRQRDPKKRALKQLPHQRLVHNVHLHLSRVALILPTGSEYLKNAKVTTKATIAQKPSRISPYKIRKS